MPLRNRVTPFSAIEADPARGLFMGNRGRLHDDRKQLASGKWRTKSWVCCVTTFKDRRRALMAPKRYTELFFLDEAVALAAGHRPCGECRRPAYRQFLAAWSAATGRAARAAAIDDALHADRAPRLRERDAPLLPVGSLPDGCFVALPSSPQVVRLKLDDRLLTWSHAGYVEAVRRPADEVVELLTPAASVLALRHGYRPAVHPTARA